MDYEKLLVPFEDNKCNTKGIDLFGVFCTYMSLNCYRLYEPIYHVYHTAFLYDFLQQPCCILNMEIELQSVSVMPAKPVKAQRK